MDERKHQRCQHLDLAQIEIFLIPFAVICLQERHVVVPLVTDDLATGEAAHWNDHLSSVFKEKKCRKMQSGPPIASCAAEKFSSHGMQLAPLLSGNEEAKTCLLFTARSMLFILFYFYPFSELHCFLNFLLADNT